jgi:hypothetical protein
VKPDFLAHLRHAWPLTLVAVLLTVYLPIALFTGTFYTNQGNIKKVSDPQQYWIWVRRFFALCLICWAVLIASYQLR